MRCKARNRVVRLRIWLAMIATAVVTPVTFGPASAAFAAWSAGGSGRGGAAATTMPTGSTPSGSVIGSSVTVTWNTANMVNGSPVAGYVINRSNASNGGPATVGAGCSGMVTTTTCTEQSVPAGTWIYTDTPVQANWTGGASNNSAAITVG